MASRACAVASSCKPCRQRSFCSSALSARLARGSEAAARRTHGVREEIGACTSRSWGFERAP
eukprot:11193287-Alexandrium_andersonii.AAC.1